MKTIQVLLLLGKTLNFNGCFEFREVNLRNVEKEISVIKYLKKYLKSAAMCFSRYGMLKYWKIVNFLKILNQQILKKN